MTRSLFPARMSVGMFAMLLSVSGAPLSAQADAGSVVHFGVIGGATIPHAEYEALANTGWNAGAPVSFGAPRSPVSFRIDGQ